MSQLTDHSSGSVPTSPQFAATLQRAIVYAEEQAHRLVTAEHLLLALSEDPDAVTIFQRKSIDLDQLRNEIASIVSRNNDRFAYGDAGQPIYSSDLLRVLSTASGAASARRPIDGALVLSAIIADGMTPAAELIRLYGLTFEEVSRGSRQAPAAPAASPPPPAHPSLAAVRTSARESVLGYRQRPAAPARLDNSDEPVTLPPPMQPAARAGAPLRRPAAPGAIPVRMPLEEPPRQPVNGNGQWQAAFDAGARGNGHHDRPLPPPDPGYDDPVEAHFAPMDWNGQPPNGAGPRGADAAGSDYSYPDDMPPAREHLPPAREQPAQQPRGPAADHGVPPTRRPRGQSVGPPAAGAQPKTRGRKSAKTRRAVERGLLIENIPRRLTAGKPVLVEARIARQDIEAALVEMGGGDQQPMPLAHAMTVRLRAENGSVAVESASPETQWLDGALGILDDDFASWRWTLTPQSAGAERLQLILSARAVSEEGLLGEAALPSQTIDVRVTTNVGSRFRSLALWTTLIAAALAIGAVAEKIFHLLGR